MLRTPNQLASLMLCASASVLGAALMAVSPAIAQNVPAATETAVGNLLQKLVNKKVLSRKDAQEMMDGFHGDLQKGAAAAPQPAPAPEPGAVRVPYVSKTVKQEIVEQVKSEVMAKARDEHWAAPNETPEWTKRIHVFGDVRVRDEGRFFDKPRFDTSGKQIGGNEPGFVDAAAVNAGSPIDLHAAIKAFPFLNSTQDRNFVRLRARLGVSAEIGDGFSATIRLASGSDTSPVTTNQTLANDFGKKAFWLDQAFIQYEPIAGDALILGRMPQPFVRTDLVWDDDINPDGFAIKGGYDFLGKKLNVHAVAAAFTLDGVADNAPTNALSTNKVGMSPNRWMFGGQIGASYTADRLKFGLDAAYYNYANVRSKLSAPCRNLDEAPITGCSSDATRPTFMQKGNTLFTLRDITYPDSTNTSEPQYFGLASKFEVLDLIANADFAATDKFHVMFTGDYARNLAYSRNAILGINGGVEGLASNNETCVLNSSDTLPSGANCTDPDPNTGNPYGHHVFKSGNNAWFAKLTVGSPAISRRWDWNTFFSYEYIQPDALLDAFTDSDFHLGGTNAKGFTVGANLGLAKNTWFTAKWLSADAVSGPPFAVDVLQLDLTTKF